MATKSFVDLLLEKLDRKEEMKKEPSVVEQTEELIAAILGIVIDNLNGMSCSSDVLSALDSKEGINTEIDVTVNNTLSVRFRTRYKYSPDPISSYIVADVETSYRLPHPEILKAINRGEIRKRIRAERDFHGGLVLECIDGHLEITIHFEHSSTKKRFPSWFTKRWL